MNDGLIPTFLRPWWLTGLLLLPLLAVWWRHRARQRNVWRETVDAHLLPHLLEGASMRSQWGLWLAMAAWGLAILALSGPSWRSQPQPLWQAKAPLVIALELSDAMQATDLPPSRLLQARALVGQVLKQRAGGQVGLVVYSDDAFTVSPLTDDSANVAVFLDALVPDIMPADGQNAARGIVWAQRLLEQAGYAQGDILLLAHAADRDAQRAAEAAAEAGFRVSVLGLGTAAGGVYRDAAGSIHHSRLDAASLRSVANAGRGRYATAASANALASLGVLTPASSDDAAGQGEKRRIRADQGYWLLLPLLLLSLPVFRRGPALVLVLAMAALPISQPAQAAEGGWWRRADQQAQASARRGDEAYRKGDFAAAARAYADVPGADGAYNRGNALAKQGQYQQAVEAYDQALRMQPGMADAEANRKTVLQRLRQQPPPKSQNQQQNRNPSRDNRNAGGNQQENPQGGDPGPQTGQDAPTSPSQPSQSPPPSQQNDATGQGNNAASPLQQQATDPAAQQQADAAQREAMQRELQQRQARQAGQQQAGRPQQAQSPAERERALATEAWLRRVPDDPGALLRAKFRLEHERRQTRGDDP